MPAFNYDLAAAILVEAAFNGDQAASEHWGISIRSIQRYRAKLGKDKKLASSVADKKKVFEGRWADNISPAITNGISYLTKAIQEIASTPEGIHAVAGAVKLLSEIEMTKRMLDARLARQG